MPKHERRTYHEAGHAVLAARFEIGIGRVAIKRLPGKLSVRCLRAVRLI
jgi:hypothetical protein